MLRTQGFGLGTQGRGSGEDPLLDRGDLGVGEFRFLLRHLAALEHLEQMTFRRLPRDEGGTGLSSFEQETLESHIEPAFTLPILAVTMKAVRLQDGTHVFLKDRRPRRDRSATQQCENHEPCPMSGEMSEAELHYSGCYLDCIQLSSRVIDGIMPPDPAVRQGCP